MERQKKCLEHCEDYHISCPQHGLSCRPVLFAVIKINSTNVNREDGENIFLRNSGNCPQRYTESQHSRTRCKKHAAAKQVDFTLLELFLPSLLHAFQFALVEEFWDYVFSYSR